ncbi:MAG: TRAP transporter large permease [Halanaerobiales bacterium]
MELTLIMLGAFFFQILIGLPLFVAMLFTTIVGFFQIGNLSLISNIPREFFSGMDVFSLMAIPFFVFAGDLMNKSGLTDRLLDLSRELVGRVRGGLGHINVLVSILFAGVNGSAAADSSALGALLIPAMAKEGYPRPYAAGITAGSSLIGPIIPPSIFMVLYGSMTGTSIGGLFIAGIIPGILLGIAFMGMNHFYAKKYNFPYKEEKTSFKKIIKAFYHSLIALIGPFIIIGGIVGGFATPTESGAIAVLYIFLVGILITRELNIKKLKDAVVETTKATSAIYIIIGAAMAVSWILKWEQVPQQMTDALLGFSDSRIVLMLILSFITFIIGMFMEEVATLVLLTPIFTPIAMASGINAFQFGVVIVLNITIALITPPMGACVFIVSSVGNVKLEKLFKNIWPFVLVAVSVLILIVLFPALTTTLPNIYGF